jgi:hypothetical protein
MTDLVQLTYWDETTQTEKDCYPVVPEQATRNIGEIVTSTIPLTDAGLHLLDGSLISGTGAYADFVTYIAGLVSTYPDLFETEADWQTAVTTYGVCGKFVYDSVNNTVRLPKITGIVEGTTDLTALGDLVEAGLPNITGTWTYFGGNAYGSDSSLLFTGAIQRDGTASTSKSSGGGSATATGIASIDASRSSSIYGNSNTVQPQTIKVLYYIVIATSTKTNIQVDIDEVTTDLNGKADNDLSNTTPTVSFATAMNNAGIRTVVETYQNGSSWYRVYSDGWCEQGGKIVKSSSTTRVTFLKPFSSLDYTLVNGVKSDNSNSSSYRGVAVEYASSSSNYEHTSTTGFTCYVQASSAQDWFACGYIN